MNLGFPVLGIIALILATWTTNAVNAFSGGLALINVFDIPKKRKSRCRCGRRHWNLISSCGDFKLLYTDYVCPFCDGATSGGVMIAAYWLINKGDRTKWRPTPGVNKLGVFHG